MVHEDTAAIFYRHWHHFPSGRRVERIARCLRNGQQIAISRVTDSTGLIEFTFSTGATATSPPPTEDFSTERFGSQKCTSEDFDLLYAEMVNAVMMPKHE
jgi:hypothetical protein